MTAEMRLIGDPAELSGIEDALAPVLKLSGRRRYSSRRSDDELRYYKASAIDNPAAPSKDITVRRVDDLKLKLSDLDGRNHVMICADFPAPGYIEYGLAASLNEEFQDSIRRIISSGLNDVLFRLDQSYKPPRSSIAVYHSGNDWMTIPYGGYFPPEDDL